jgi:hypothetical protein
MTTTKVIRFNWPKYLGAAAIAASALAAGAAGAPGWIRYPLWAAGVPGAVWTLTSLAATWWVYEHRKVYERLTTDLPNVGNWSAVHAGFDDSVPVLRASIGRPPAAVAQIAIRPGASLRRARKLSQRPAADGLPLTPGSLDSIFVTFAAHEVRGTGGQRALFTALQRALRPGGRSSSAWASCTSRCPPCSAGIASSLAPRRSTARSATCTASSPDWPACCGGCCR